MRPHPTKIETERRVAQIYHWICEGRSTGDIARLAAQTWGLSQSALERRYLPRARRLLSEDLAVEREYARSRLLAISDRIIEQAMGSGNYGIALKALDFQAKIYGLYAEGQARAIAEVEREVRDAPGFSITPEKIRQIREQVYGIYDEC
ncbi:MAG: hypothetical protein ONB06_08540 [candidate division KSB1 bacterium]|nr:hypothetical protein [candidate division KSB1 bacterium]